MSYGTSLTKHESLTSMLSGWVRPALRAPKASASNRGRCVRAHPGWEFPGSQTFWFARQMAEALVAPVANTGAICVPIMLAMPSSCWRLLAVSLHCDISCQDRHCAPANQQGAFPDIHIHIAGHQVSWHWEVTALRLQEHVSMCLNRILSGSRIIVSYMLS